MHMTRIEPRSLRLPFGELALFVKENSDRILSVMQTSGTAGGTSEESPEPDSELENEFMEKFGNEAMMTDDEILTGKYRIYSSRNPVLIMLAAIIIWLWPVYRFNFRGGGEPDDRVIRRVLNLPTFIFILPWAAGLWGLILKLGLRSIEGSGISTQTTANFIASLIMYGSLAGFINSWFTIRYINNGIARHVFV